MTVRRIKNTSVKTENGKEAVSPLEKRQYIMCKTYNKQVGAQLFIPSREQKVLLPFPFPLRAYPWLAALRTQI